MDRPQPSLPTGPIPKPSTAYERTIATSAIFTEQLQVNGQPWEIKVLFLENRYQMIKGVRTRIGYYKVYVNDPSGVRVYGTRGSLWKTTRFMEYFHAHREFPNRRALVEAADTVNMTAEAEATELYSTRVD